MKVSFLTLSLILSFQLISPSLKGQKQDLNEEIIAFVDQVIDKKVGRGECWDLLAEALDETGANWTRTELFGRQINYPNEKLKPGDMVVFKNIEYVWGGKSSQHYAIIYEVTDQTHFKLADQNVGGIHKVRIRDFDMNQIKSGQVTFYRSQK